MCYRRLYTWQTRKLRNIFKSQIKGRSRKDSYRGQYWDYRALLRAKSVGASCPEEGERVRAGLSEEIDAM